MFYHIDGVDAQRNLIYISYCGEYSAGMFRAEELDKVRYSMQVKYNMYPKARVVWRLAEKGQYGEGVSGSCYHFIRFIYELRKAGIPRNDIFLQCADKDQLLDNAAHDYMLYAKMPGVQEIISPFDLFSFAVTENLTSIQSNDPEVELIKKLFATWFEQGEKWTTHEVLTLYTLWELNKPDE